MRDKSERAEKHLDDNVAAIIAADEAGVGTAMRVFEAAEARYYAASASIEVPQPLVVTSAT
jgi:hypothetical protein